jgi:hypothetical protein
MRGRARIGVLLAVVVVGRLGADDFYVDPVNGSPSGDGSAGDPWRTIEEVIAAGLIETRDWESLPYEPGLDLVPVHVGAPVGPGDRLLLRTGYHGEIFLRGAYNLLPIEIAAAAGHAPRVARVLVSAAGNWILRGLSISPSHAVPPIDPGAIVDVEDHSWFGPSWDVTVEDCDIFSVDDAAAWTAQDWVDLPQSGVDVSSDRVTLLDNAVRNVRFGISVSGDDARILHNLVENFSADGLRGLGDRGLFEGNRIQNSLVEDPPDPNHDDGFQSWSVGPGGVGTGAVHGVVLRGNVFLNHVNPAHPLRASMQAIGCFDGRFVDWVIENNVVVTDHWHGISLYGADNARIVNNTVIDLDAASPGPPWIMLNDHEGAPSTDSLVRNNIATDFAVDGTGITMDHNLEIANPPPAGLFVAPPFDLHLPAGSPALDAGVSTAAPLRDIEGVPRPQGAAHDLGAHERCAGCLFLDDFETGDTDAWSTTSGSGV